MEGLIGVIVGAVLVWIGNYFLERRRSADRKSELEREAARERDAERERWRRQIRLEVYSRLLADDRHVTDAANQVRTLSDPVVWQQRAEMVSKLQEATAAFDVSYAQTYLVGSEPLMEMANKLRDVLLDEAQRAIQGEDVLTDRLHGARLMFAVTARMELGLPLEFEPPTGMML